MENSKKTIDELIEAIDGTIGTIAPNGSLVEKIGKERYSAILRKTVYSLPDRPSDAGMTAAQIKEAFYKPITDKEGSIYAEINRIADELNLGGAQIEEVLTLMSELVAAIYNNSVDKTSFDDKMKEVAESLGKCVKRADGKGENIYASAGGKDQLVPISSEALPDTAVKRDNAGHVKVTAPAADDDAISLGYAGRTFAKKGDVPTSVANALIGSEMGEVVALKDVSPIEHRLRVKVESKNLFDVSKVKTGENVVNNGDGTITVRKEGGNLCGSTLGEMCPDLKVGDVFTLSLRVANAVEDTKQDAFIYLVEMRRSVKSGTTLTTTQDMLNSNVYLYTSTSLNQGNVTEGIVSEIQVELRTTATPHTPYIADTSGVKLKVCGENLFDVYSITDCIKMSNSLSVGGSREGDVLYNPCGSYGDGTYFTGFSMYLKPGWYHISADVFATSPETGSGCARLYNPDTKTYSGNPSYKAYALNAWTRYDWRVSIETANEYYLSLSAGGNASNYSNLDIRFKNIMITPEFDPNQYPAYVPYVTTGEHTQGEEIKSIYPSTTLMTDTEGAIISVEYNRDLNKAFEELMNLILSLGGNLYV